MKLSDKIREKVRSYLRIENPQAITVNIDQLGDFDVETFVNLVWCRGKANEIEQLYHQMRNHITNTYFWGSTPTQGSKIRKIHTGLPGLIVDVLTNVCTDDLNTISLSARQEEWDSICEENELKELISTAVSDVLALGDGAFKLSYDKSVSELPIIEFFPANRVDYEYVRGRIKTIIFKTDKVIKGKNYTLKELYSKNSIRYALEDEQGKDVDISVFDEFADYLPVSWNSGFSVSSNIKTTIEVITKIVSIALLAIGAIIAFSGSALPLGIALIAAGAVGLVASVALNWNTSTNKVSEVITTITAIVGGALLAIGAILAFSGMATALGIGLIAAGAVTLAASVAPSWDSMPQKTKNIIGIISGVVGSALLVLGAILLFSNSNPALGLGLMVAGGATLAAAIAPNWNTIVEKVKSVWKSIKTYFNENIKPWFTKAKWNDLISKIFSAFSSSKFVKQIKNIWTGIKTFWNDNIAPWFTKEKWKNLAEKCGNGLKSGFKSAINSVISFFETMINRVIDKFNSISFTVPDWIPAIGGNTYGLSISKVSIPRLAQGGWVAANNPQLAIIGDNTREGEIVTPESKIYEQVIKALKAMGGTISGAVQTVKLAIELVIRYPDGRTIIKQINEAQIQEGRILLEV